MTKLTMGSSKPINVHELRIINDYPLITASKVLERIGQWVASVTNHTVE